MMERKYPYIVSKVRERTQPVSCHVDDLQAYDVVDLTELKDIAREYGLLLLYNTRFHVVTVCNYDVIVIKT